MRLLVFGATGGTGRHIVEQAIDLGHEVTAFVRDPSRLKLRSDRLSFFAGDVMHAAAIDAAMPGKRAVLIALGTMPEDKGDRSRRQPQVPVCSIGTRHIVESMVRHGIHRVVVESSLAVGTSRMDSRLGAATFVRWILKDVMADKQRQEDILRNSAVNWTIVRPARLTDGPRSQRIRRGETLPWTLLSTVSRADVASCMLSALEDGTTFQKSISILG